MSAPSTKTPKSAMSVKQYLASHIDASPKRLAEIARDIGYERPNIMSMLKTGVTKVPIDKAPKLAKSLGMDPAFFTRMCLNEYMPELAAALEEIHMTPISKNELKILTLIRDVSGDNDPELTRDGEKGLATLIKEEVKAAKRLR